MAADALECARLSAHSSGHLLLYFISGDLPLEL